MNTDHIQDPLTTALTALIRASVMDPTSLRIARAKEMINTEIHQRFPSLAHETNQNTHESVTGMHPIKPEKSQRQGAEEGQKVKVAHICPVCSRAYHWPLLPRPTLRIGA